jgi:hypothetical protein
MFSNIGNRIPQMVPEREYLVLQTKRGQPPSPDSKTMSLHIILRFLQKQHTVPGFFSFIADRVQWSITIIPATQKV